MVSAVISWATPRTSRPRCKRFSKRCSGITFFDNCWEYHRGKSEDWMGKPLSDAEIEALRTQVRAFAADGRFELFKTTKKFGGDVGRQQQHFPTSDELPA